MLTEAFIAWALERKGRFPTPYRLDWSDDERLNRSAHLLWESASWAVDLVVWDSGEAELSYGRLGRAVGRHYEFATADDLTTTLDTFLDEAFLAEKA